MPVLIQLPPIRRFGQCGAARPGGPWALGEGEDGLRFYSPGIVAPPGRDPREAIIERLFRLRTPDAPWTTFVWARFDLPPGELALVDMHLEQGARLVEGEDVLAVLARSEGDLDGAVAFLEAVVASLVEQSGDWRAWREQAGTAGHTLLRFVVPSDAPSGSYEVEPHAEA